jgi:hypothetical protein
MIQASFRALTCVAVSCMCLACDVDFDVDTVVDRTAIRVAKKRWMEQKVHDYNFVYQEKCFCAETDSSGIRVEVRGDKALSAVGSSNGVPFPDAAVSIDELFDRVLAKSADGADDFDVHFNDERRFIDRVTLDPDENAEDDEYGFEIPCFSPEEKACPFPLVSEDKCKEKAGVVTEIPKNDPDNVCEAGSSGLGQVERDVSVCCVPDA